jgi:hypothetical protein
LIAWHDSCFLNWSRKYAPLQIDAVFCAISEGGKSDGLFGKKLLQKRHDVRLHGRGFSATGKMQLF